MFPFYELFRDYMAAILAKAKDYRPIELTSAIGFAGVASELSTVFTPPVDADVLIVGAHVDFSNSGVTVRIEDTSSGYQWNVLQSTGSTNVQGTPVTALAGVTTQVMPVLGLVIPFFLSRQSKLKMDFRNSAAGPTTGGLWTWAGLKLLS